MIKIKKIKRNLIECLYYCFIFNNKKFHLGDIRCLLLKIIKYIKNESENKNL